MRLVLSLLLALGLSACQVPGDGECVPGMLCLGLDHVPDSGVASPASPRLAEPGFIDPRGTWMYVGLDSRFRVSDLRGDRVIISPGEAEAQFFYHRGNNYWESADGDFYIEFESDRTGLIWGRYGSEANRIQKISG